MNLFRYLIVAGLLVIFISCRKGDKSAVFFDLLESDITGLTFNNKLTSLPDLNMLSYMYFYNGAGVGAGDFNNDGLTDLFFAGNQVRSRLYLNSGNMKFRDITELAGIPDDKGWSTGISVVDINQDGLLDIYVCRVGKFASLQNHNLLLVCKGLDKNNVPFYEDQSVAYGLDFSGFSTQAAFFDYDLDGDLDVYLLNHSLRYSSTFQPRENYTNSYDSLSGDRFYRNDGKKFTDVTKQAGIQSSVIGYGLGIAVSDINLDGYPDLYIANDFQENDYLYLNRGNGSFSEELDKHIMHTSQFSMGVDIGDINNDGHQDIITVDMLPEDPIIQKSSLVDNEYNLFNMKLRYGFSHQYARNNLQLNRRNGMFSEIGFYAGISATDWSWAPLFADFDNDGKKDLFVSNGIPKRFNDIDFINFISNEQIQARIRDNIVSEEDLSIIHKFPEVKLRNKFFRNNGELKFNDLGDAVINNKPSYSNGAVYADFDNDGDLDIVTSNIDDPVFLYRNQADSARSVKLFLKGDRLNAGAIGSKLVVFKGAEVTVLEKFPVRGFQSSMEIPLQYGTASGKPDSVLLIWPDNSYEKVNIPGSVNQIILNYRKGLPVFNYQLLREIPAAKKFEDIARLSGLNYLHRENEFIEFNREPLIPFMVSGEGPALAVSDFNKDGLTDVFIGSSKGFKPALFLQLTNQSFTRSDQPFLDADSIFEDVDAVWEDYNGDGYADLVVASGGNEFYGKDERLVPRIYINEKGTRLVKQASSFPQVQSTASCILSFDFNRDGFMDIFLGGRAVPFQYGEMPRSYIFINNGKGRFSDQTEEMAPQLLHAGMVKDAIISDVDKDGKKDLVIAYEWGGIHAYMQSNQTYQRKIISASKGWWNCIKPVDIDNDGDIDFVLGNLGENSRLKASEHEPVRLYYGDFDDNGTREQVMSFYQGGVEIPFSNKTELEKQMPGLKKKFLYARDYAKASMSQIFDQTKLNQSRVLTADYFSNAILINNGNMVFTLNPLPDEAQFSTVRAIELTDYNDDGLTDLLLGGNFYKSSVSMGRNDADYGTILINKGHGQLVAKGIPGLIIKNEIRKIRSLKLGEQTVWVIARNNDSTLMIRKQGK